MTAGSEDLLKDFQIDNCRVCFDIKDWQRRAQKAAFERKPEKSVGSAAAAAAGAILFTAAAEEKSAEPVPPEYKACPPDAIELGRSTWTFLHTMSVYYPEQPTTTEQTEMSTFLRLFSQLYPCSYCAAHLRKEMVKDPPTVGSRSALAQWLCRMHNEVNERLGKPIFDCEKVEERWRDGPSDGFCG